VSSIVVWLISHECQSLLLLKRDTVALDKSNLKLFDRRKNSTYRVTSAIHLSVSSGHFLAEDDSEQNTKPRPVLDQPPVTDTVLERISSPPKSLPPKIVVLGSTGRIGRRIIRQLMALQSDITVVAFVRNYERACEVLYDELIIQRESKGPKLQLVVMDLVPSCHVAGYIESDDKEEEDDDNDEHEFAVSASRFYNNDISEYHVPASKKDDAVDLDPYLPLQSAITNATAVISAIGTVRTTVPFADYLFKPWRIFMNTGSWCKDKTHPYYVNYMVHKKLLEYCEDAQRKRNREWRVWQNSERRKASRHVDDKGDNDQSEKVDRIRIVRITDHCLSNPAWDIVNVLTNAFRSLVFRYQEKCEKLLSKSNLVDTIILRPGDLLDDLRNDTTTTMSVNVDGKLPSPVYVGRDDIASLATLLALSDLNPQVKGQKEAHSLNGTTVKSVVKRNNRYLNHRDDDQEPRHWNIAVGWTGKSGKGYSNAEKCMEYIVKEHGRRKRSDRRKQAIRNLSPVYRMIWRPYQQLTRQAKERALKPYRVFTFLPMFFLVYPTLFSLISNIGQQIPAVRNAAIYILSITAPTRKRLVDYTVAQLKELLQKRNMAKNAARLLID